MNIITTKQKILDLKMLLLRYTNLRCLLISYDTSPLVLIGTVVKWLLLITLYYSYYVLLLITMYYSYYVL